MHRMNPDGTLWCPCLQGTEFAQFILSRGRNDPIHPAYIPKLHMSGKPNPSKLGDADLDHSMDKSMRRFCTSSGWEVHLRSPFST